MKIPNFLDYVFNVCFIKETVVEIKEKDLFEYIFHPEELNQNVFDYISLNTSKFKKQFEILNSMKNIITGSVSQEIFNGIIEKVKNFSVN